MKFILITNQSLHAQAMALAGVDRIMVDLEINGKEQRQGHLDTVISRHSFEDITNVRRALDKVACGELMVRINPLNPFSRSEIEKVIACGADRIMFPMFTHPDEVKHCLEFIGGRVPLTLLVETAAAFARLHTILDIPGFDDVHIGLNDLHLDMGLDFMFELLSSNLLDCAARMMNELNIPFGIGGIACLGTGLLPAELILAAHLRLGSERVILSRSFTKSIENGASPKVEIRKIQSFLDRDDLNLSEMCNDLDRIVASIASSKRS